MEELWNEIGIVVEEGIEKPKIDLKSSFSLDTSINKEEFVKDVTAIANTKGEVGYIVIGILDQSQRRNNNYIVGFDHPNPDELQCQMVDVLNNWVDPPIEISLSVIVPPFSKRKIGIIQIFSYQRRPYLIKKNGQKLRQGQIYIRRGTQTFIASRQEVLEMTGDYWRVLIEEVRETLTRQYQDIEKDEREHYNIAQQACKRLYHALPKTKRKKVLQDILANKPHYFDEWLKENNGEI